MNDQIILQSINKTEDQLFLGGAVSFMGQAPLVFQLIDTAGTSIPCRVRTTKNEEEGSTSFVLFARVKETEQISLHVSGSGHFSTADIDAASLKKNKQSGLRNKINPVNIAKARKFLRERGLKNTLLRVNSEVRKETADVDYNIWKKFHDPSKEELEEQRSIWKTLRFAEGKTPLISIVIPAYNTDRSLLLQLLDSIKNQTYPEFEVLIADGSSEDNHTVKETMASYSKADPRFLYVPVGGNKGISGNTNAGLAKASGDYIAFCDHDDALPPWALFEIAKAISENPRVQFLYTDEDKVDEDGNTFYDPHFKSDFNLFLLETCNYISHFNVVRKDLLEKAGYLNSDYDGSQDYDFVLRCSELLTEEEYARLEKYREALEETSDAALLSKKSGLLEDSVRKLQEGRFISELAVHIPKVCYHWRISRSSTAFDSKAKLYAAKAGCKAVRDHFLRLQTKFLTVENSPVFGFYRIKYSSDDTPDIGILRIDDPSDGPENTVRLWNESVKNAAEEYVLLLDNRMILKDNNYLYEMLGQLNRKNVGAVGARIVDGHGATVSAGQIITKEDLVTPAFSGLYEYQGSYMHRMMCPQNYSALDGRCLLIRRSLYEKLGGLDETYQADMAFADLCLRIRQLGYLLVYTPYAVFEMDGQSQNEGGQEDFRRKWADFLNHTDPYYNPQFLPEKGGFHIGIKINDMQDKTDS